MGKHWEMYNVLFSDMQNSRIDIEKFILFMIKFYLIIFWKFFIFNHSYVKAIIRNYYIVEIIIVYMSVHEYRKNENNIF